MPGGGIEPDETPEETVVRETLEETGLEIHVDELAAVFGGPQLHHTYVSGDQGAYVMIAYRCSIVGGTLRPDGDEITDTRWISADDLATLSTPPWGSVVMGAALARS